MSDLRSYPVSPDAATNARWRANRMRYLILRGRLKDVLDAWLPVWVPDEQRQSAWGRGDASKNLAKATVSQIATLYDETPAVLQEDLSALAQMEQICEDGGVWQMAQEHQRLTVGIREGGIRVFVDPRGPGEVRFRMVPAHLLEAYADPRSPDEPVTVYEYQIRSWEERRGATTRTKTAWVRERWDVSDPEDPTYRIETEDGKEDLTERLEPDLVGAPYPYRAEDGRPILPIVLYHAARTNELFDCDTLAELFESTIKCGVFWTFFGHVLLENSFPIRYALNAILVGLGPDDKSGNVPFLQLDPSMIARFQAMRPDQPVSMGTFPPGGDPQVVGQAIRDYAMEAVLEAGVSPTDIQRTHADARSGYAIQMTREGQRRQQRKYKPQFRRGDRQLLRVVAIVAKQHDIADLPETGWDIEYVGIPLSIEERKQLMEEFEEQRRRGVMSEVELVMRLRNVPRSRAIELLRQIRADIAEFRQEPVAAPSEADDEDEQDKEDADV